MFESFKEHELEFETYLRPIMQEVIREGGGQTEAGGRSWEDS